MSTINKCGIIFYWVDLAAELKSTRRNLKLSCLFQDSLILILKGGEKNILNYQDKNFFDEKNGIIYNSECVRENVRRLAKSHKMTLKEVSEKADINIDAFNAYIGGKTKEIRAVSLYKLAKVFDITMEGLANVPVINSDIDILVKNAENLSRSDQHYLAWLSNNLCNNYKKSPKKKQTIAVRSIDCKNGIHTIGEDIGRLDTSNLPYELRVKVFMALQFTCDCFMPKYNPYNYLLIANDRMPSFNENCVIDKNGILWILQAKKFGNVDGIKFYSIRDRKREIALGHEIHEYIVGYIAGILSDADAIVETW